MNTELVEAARQLGAKVGPVIPIRGKIPLWTDWPNRATRTPNGEPEWSEATGVGLVTGAMAGYFVLDVDPAKGGMEALAALEQKHGPLPATWKSCTGGSGIHVFFRHPGFPVPNSTGKLGPGLDVRGEGGQVVAPPSRHPSGTAYRWADGRQPGSVEIAPGPAWLLEMLKPKAPPPAPTGRRAAGGDVLRRARAYLTRIPGALSGAGGHDQTWKAALAIVCGFGLDEQSAYELLASEYNPRCSPPWSEKELRHKVRDAAQNSELAWGYLLAEEKLHPAASRAREEPGCDDDDPTPVAAATAAAIRPASLRDLLYRPTRDTLAIQPRRRRYMLTVPGDGTGVFVAGEAGLLAAPGGTGKSYALMQLAVAVATGTTWFGDGRGWKAEGGRVLFLLGEEEREEADRRLYYGARAAGIISPADIDLVLRNLDLLPLRGKPVALTTALDSDLGLLPETRWCGELRQIISGAATEGSPYSLVILDPLSRFAGTDVETDNAAATRFVQVLESLTGPECGSPSLLISAHERKPQMNDDPDSADPIRGSSALKDAFRWAARLQQRKRKDGAPDLLRLRTVKTNNVKSGQRLDLCRPPELHGALRVATQDEIAAYDQRGGASATPVDGQPLEEKIIAELLAKGPGSGSELADRRLRLNKAAVLQACNLLEQQGRIGRQGKKWVLTTAKPVESAAAEPAAGALEAAR